MGNMPSTDRANPSLPGAAIECEQAKEHEQEGLLRVRAWNLGFARWVADGTRTRNNQNHNLELYH